MLDKKIRYFITVADEGSFSAAARKLFLSQSALSQQISILENELGILLFDRSGYRPVLTEAGKKYYAFCTDAEHQYQMMLKELKENHQKAITIAFSGIYENKDLIRLTYLFKQKHKDVSFSYLEGDFRQINEDLANGTADIAFGLKNSFDSETFHTKDLFPYHMCVITSFDHPLANRSELKPDDLINQKFVVLSRKFGKNFHKKFMNSFLQDGLSKDQIVMETDTFDELIAAVSIGEGISIVSKEAMDGKSVHMIPLIYSSHHEMYAMAWNRHSHNELFNAFITDAEKYFNESL